MTEEIEFAIKKFEDLTTSELYNIMSFRQSIFVVEQDCPYLDADYLDQDSWHVWYIEEGQIVAYTRLIPKGKSYDHYSSIGRVAVNKTHRGTGLGKKLMAFSIDKLLRLEGGPVKISAQTYTISFYQSLGFVADGEEYLEDDIPHIAMIRE
jgi:ElaA protein